MRAASRLLPLLALAALVCAPAAQAVTASSNGTSGLVINATDSGMSSGISIGLYSDANGLHWIASHTNGELSPGLGCAALGANTVRCPRQAEGVTVQTGDGVDRVFPRAGSLAFVDTVRADLGPGNDNYAGFPTSDVVTAGSGNDILFGAAGDDVLFGGGDGDQITGNVGRDQLNGDSGDDVFFDRVPAGTDAGSEDDSYSGGTGFDSISYDDRPAIILLMGNEETTGGEIGSGEGDGLRGLERYIGGDGDDRMNAAFSSVAVDLRGVGGADQLLGSSVNDTIVGGAGAEVLMKGNAGNDVIDAKVGETVGGVAVAVADPVIDCGTGTDLAVLDLKDDLSPIGCESIDRAPAGEHPDATLPARRLVLRASGGMARVALRCPRSRRNGCKGSVRLRRGKRAFASTGYRLRRGRRARVSVAAPFRGRASVVTLEKGRIGPKSLIRAARVR